MEDFLITDRNLVPEVSTNCSDESLIIVEENDVLDLALYLDEDVMVRLRDDDPTKRLHDGNLSDFCTALEGVSHFLCVAWRAGFERGVSLLELELQAEIDKYVTSLLLLGRQRMGRVPRQLSARLFANPSYFDDLENEDRERYQRANDYAAHYCDALERRFLLSGALMDFVQELRRFYRLTHLQKLQRIEKYH